MNNNVINRKNILRKFFFSEDTRSLCRLKDKNTFSRNRKITFSDILLMTYNKQAKTTSMEIRNYEKNMKGNENVNYTNEAYLKQRRNLNPEVFKEANKVYLLNFYNDDKENILKEKNYITLAIDGSKFELPNTPQNREYFGKAINQYKEEKHPARALLSTIYDINNQFYLDIQIDKYTASETALAKKNIEKAQEIINDDMIVIFDRSYASLEMFLWLNEHNIKFIMRLNNRYFKNEIKNMKSNDEIIYIQHTNPRLQNLKRNYPNETKKLEKLKETRVRCTKIKLSSDSDEIILSNLEFEQFTKEEIIELYGRRWNIETSYNCIKNKLKIEAFTGNLPILIKQDIYAQILVYNQLQDMVFTANQKLKEKLKDKKLKLDYKINENIAIGLFKNELIRILLIADTQESNKQYEKLLDEMTRYATAIRKGRPTQPRLFNRSNRYRTNMKSSF